MILLARNLCLPRFFPYVYDSSTVSELAALEVADPLAAGLEVSPSFAVGCMNLPGFG
jgi:hypothetical protein